MTDLLDAFREILQPNRLFELLTVALIVPWAFLLSVWFVLLCFRDAAPPEDEEPGYQYYYFRVPVDPSGDKEPDGPKYRYYGFKVPITPSGDKDKK